MQAGLISPTLDMHGNSLIANYHQVISLVRDQGYIRIRRILLTKIKMIMYEGLTIYNFR